MIPVPCRGLLRAGILQHTCRAISSQPRHFTTMNQSPVSCVKTLSNISKFDPEAHLNSETLSKQFWSLDAGGLPGIRHGEVFVKIGGEHCRKDFAWLEYWNNISLPSGVSVPKLHSGLIEFISDDIQLYAFARDWIEGSTISEHIYHTGSELTSELADCIVSCVSSLTTAAAANPITDYVVPGINAITLDGHMFPHNFSLYPPSDEVNLTIKSQRDVRQVFEAYLKTSLEGCDWDWAWGDISPGNIFLDNHTGGLICTDFGYAMWLPKFYDWWTLQINGDLQSGIYSPKFTQPLIAAFERYYGEHANGRASAFQMFTEMRLLLSTRDDLSWPGK